VEQGLPCWRALHAKASSNAELLHLCAARHACVLDFVGLQSPGLHGPGTVRLFHLHPSTITWCVTSLSFLCPLPQGVPTSSLGFSDNLLAGGLGGTAFWLACYPTDIVKSKLQVS
jgi:hypothetical protein